MTNWDKAKYVLLAVLQAVATAATIQIAAGQVPVPAQSAWVMPIVSAGLLALAALLPKVGSR